MPAALVAGRALRVPAGWAFGPPFPRPAAAGREPVVREQAGVWAQPEEHRKSNALRRYARGPEGGDDGVPQGIPCGTLARQLLGWRGHRAAGSACGPRLASWHDALVQVPAMSPARRTFLLRCQAPHQAAGPGPRRGGAPGPRVGTVGRSADGARAGQVAGGGCGVGVQSLGDGLVEESLAKSGGRRGPRRSAPSSPAAQGRADADQLAVVGLLRFQGLGVMLMVEAFPARDAGPTPAPVTPATRP
jgi:hypothetical protein